MELLIRKIQNLLKLSMVKLISVLLFLLMILQMHVWFLDGIPEYYLSALILIVLSFYKIKKGYLKSLLPPISVILFSVLIFIDNMILDGLRPALVLCTELFLIGLLYSYKDNIKVKILNYITKWFSVLITISLIAFVINLVIPMPIIGIINGFQGYPESFENHLLFIEMMGKDGNFVRFSGPFVEPGHLSIACVFLIYANHFNFRQNKYLLGLFASVIFSLSLAGYVLLTIAYVMTMNWNILKIVAIVFIIQFPYMFITQIWNDGENPVNELIFSRLEYDEEKGISGNNRFSKGTDKEFERYLKSGELIWGIGVTKFVDYKQRNILNGAGYKVYMIQYGIIGTILMAGLYLSMALNARNRRFAITFFILVAFCFLQRTYVLWVSWFLPYVCSMMRQKYKYYWYSKDVENSLRERECISCEFIK